MIDHFCHASRLARGGEGKRENRLPVMGQPNQVGLQKDQR
jgi:hypothetical protein